jgi:hypothetical protein
MPLPPAAGSCVRACAPRLQRVCAPSRTRTHTRLCVLCLARLCVQSARACACFCRCTSVFACWLPRSRSVAPCRGCTPLLQPVWHACRPGGRLHARGVPRFGCAAVSRSVWRPAQGRLPAGRGGGGVVGTPCVLCVCVGGRAWTCVAVWLLGVRGACDPTAAGGTAAAGPRRPSRLTTGDAVVRGHTGVAHAPLAPGGRGDGASNLSRPSVSQHRRSSE